MAASMSATLLPALEAQAHARAVLAPALARGASPSHAYLFHGPAGTGKREVARAFAAGLLLAGARHADTVAERVARDTHPDLTWVRPSGAAEMLVSDIEEPVVAAAQRTPFESLRRVFVIEGAETMNDQAANRLLKTLEEPPRHTHLVLVADRREDVLATIASRCQLVRFDPLPAGAIAARLRAQMAAGDGGDAPEQGNDYDDIERGRVVACARLAMGDAGAAARLAGGDGVALRQRAEELVRCALRGDTAGRPWLGLLEVAKDAGASTGERALQALRDELELLPSKERKRYEREGAEAQRRGERRVRTRTLDEGLRLVELWLRDLMCVREGARDVLYAVDRREQLEEDAEGRQPGALRRGIELVADTRLSLSANVSEELALEALTYRLQGVFADDGAASTQRTST
jgi:DNA polymerase-3 subunit delta'